MLGVNGIDTVREARQRRPGLPAVRFTGHAEDNAAMAESDGFFVLLRKPIRGAALSKQIEAAISRREAA